MDDNDCKTLAIHSDLMEEYKLCQAKASNLSDNIWKTASFFSIGSLAGIFSLTKDTPLWLMPIATLFALSVLFTWWRFAQRWWSIEHTLYLRMRHIERELGLKTNLYIKYLTDTLSVSDKKNSAEKPSDFHLSNDIMAELDFLGKAEGYEFRGLQPMTKFIVVANFAAWITFFLIQIVPHINKVCNAFTTCDVTASRMAIMLIYFLSILAYGVLQWKKEK